MFWGCRWNILQIYDEGSHNARTRASRGELLGFMYFQIKHLCGAIMSDLFSINIPNLWLLSGTSNLAEPQGVRILAIFQLSNRFVSIAATNLDCLASWYCSWQLAVCICNYFFCCCILRSNKPFRRPPAHAKTQNQKVKPKQHANLISQPEGKPQGQTAPR